MDKLFGSRRYICIFVMPAFFLFVAFGLFPILYNFMVSLYRTDLMSPAVFIGFRNYSNLLRDRIFIQSVRNNLLMVAGSLIAHMPLALLLGTLLFNKIRGGKFFQSVFFLPCVICGVAIGLTWIFIYNSEFGLVNKVFELLSLPGLRRQWLSDETTVIFAIIIVVMWQYVGYHMVIQIAAMRNIPRSLYEAAEIDGASKWRQFTSITFPLIKHILKIDAVLIITGSLKYFDLVFVMTRGGPNHASEVLSTYMYYQGFRTLKYGYASAIGTVLLLLCIITIVICNKVFKSEPIEY
ncbi:MAG: sugar ABC transporter permease [Treponema sp.]|nr:sugar ABC transporter permease [Treponema sp.]